MVAIKHMDPIVGVDVHIILIPTPAGPVPTPLPHPYVGMIMDPFDYLPIVGTVIKVNGLCRATAGTAGSAVPPHIPMGGPFQKPPANDSEMFMGSTTVNADGDPFAFAGCPVLSCTDIGMPAPPRSTKKGAATDLMLPTSQAIPIPAGPMVMVGGAPTIIMPGLEALIGPLAKGMVKAVKAAARRSRRIARAVKAASDRAHGAARRVMNAVGVPRNSALRNRVHRNICSVTGHPVDIATGKVFTERVDVALGGPLPFELQRVWYSTSTYEGPLGYGWHHNYDLGLTLDPEAVLLRTADGRYVPFLPPKRGQSYYNEQDKLTLGLDDYGYWLRSAEGLTYRFARAHGRQPHDLVLSQVEDRAGHRIQFQYDARGNWAQIIDSGGRTLQVVTDEVGRIVQIQGPHPTDPSQRIVLAQYGYDGRGDLVSVQDALGHMQRMQYQGHLLVQETDRNGLSFYFEWDGSDYNARCVRTWGDGGIYDHKLTYREDLGVTIVENSLGYKTTYHHNGATVFKVVDAHGNESTTEFDDAFNVIAETDELGRTTTFEYDGRGNVSQVVQPDGAHMQLEYDGRGNLLKAIDQVEAVWTWEYDERDRLVRRTDALGRATEYTYDRGWLVAVRDVAGGVTTVGYDHQGNLTGLRSPDGTTVQCSYDQLGRVLKIVDPRGNAQVRTLDRAGQVIRIEEVDGNVREISYDGEGNVLRAKDAHYEVLFTYCGMGRVASRTQAGTTVRFEYDTEEQLVAIHNEHGAVYRFELTPTGEVRSESRFGGLMRKYQRDAAGQIERIERPDGRFSDYSYDPMGRVIAVSHNDGNVETYVYRPDGELLEASNSQGRVAFERDALGRVTREVQGKHWVDSAYDDLGARVHMRSSLGAEQRIERNVVGDVVGVEEVGGGWGVSFERDSLGLELSRSLPGGVRSRWERDRVGRPIQHEVTSGSQLTRAVSYQWDVGDRLRMVVDALHGPTHYYHDRRGNLTGARYDDGPVELRMPDAVGNLFRSEQRTDRVYGHAGELLEIRGARGSTHYRYDVEGNLIEKREPSGRVWSYCWNAAGRLQKVVRPDGSEVSFEYDALGRRTLKRYRGQTTRWVWDGHNPLHEWVEGDLRPLKEPKESAQWSADADVKRREAELQEYLAQGPPARGDKYAPITWVFEPDSFAPMARLQGARASSIVTDHLGAPVAMYDDEGQQRWAANITIYGDLRRCHGSTGADTTGSEAADDDHSTLAVRLAVPFRWPGQYEDAETGLYYNRFRYYDPEAGQYTSQDPIGLRGGLRLMAYAPDPTIEFDPLGLILSNKAVGDIGEQAAADFLERNGSKVLGTVENRSGNGLDIVTEEPGGHLRVYEVKANTSRPNHLQRQGPQAYTQTQVDRGMGRGKRKFTHKTPASRALTRRLDQHLRRGGTIQGAVIRVQVDRNSGAVRSIQLERWKKCP